jgi:SAM-dependent methyltransferase
VAGEFIRWLGVEPGRRWLDVGCGTGALTETVLALAEPASVRGVDRSDAYLELARRRVNDPRAVFEVGDAQSLPVPDASYEVAVSGLVLNFVGDPATAAREMTRAAVGDGLVAAYLWDYAGDMQLMRYFWDAAVELDAAAGELDEGSRFPLCKPEPLGTLFEEAGLAGVDVRPIVVRTPFRDFDDYWTPFLGGQGPAPGYAMSLDEERRSALRERIRSALPIAEDGSIDLTARAWAVRGQRRRG